MQILPGLDELLNNQSKIVYSIEGNKIRIFYKRKDQHMRAFFEPVWCIDIRITTDCKITHIESYYSSSYEFQDEVFSVYSSVLKQIAEIPTSHIRNFFDEINADIIKKYEKLYFNNKDLKRGSHNINNSICRVYEIEDYKSSDTYRVGKDTITNTFSKTNFSLVKNDKILDDEEKFIQVKTMIENLLRCETSRDQSYSAPQEDINEINVMYNYPLTNIANQMYKHLDGLYIYDQIFLDKFTLKNKSKILNFKSRYLFTPDYIESIRNLDIEIKLGIPRILFIKFLLICLFDNYEKFPINNMFFWSYCYFLTNKTYLIQINDKLVVRDDFYETNQQYVLNCVYRDLYDCIPKMNLILCISFDLDKLDEAIINYLEYENEFYHFDLNNIREYFNNFIK